MIRSLLPLLVAALFLPASAGAFDKIDDFLGIKFGATVQEVDAAMAARSGRKAKGRRDPNLRTLSLGGGTFVGGPVESFDFDFAEGKLARARSIEHVRELTRYQTLRKMLTEKYGEPSRELHKAMSKNRIAEMLQSRDAKLKLECEWKSGVGVEARSITLQMEKDGKSALLTVTYSDLTLVAKIPKVEATPKPAPVTPPPAGDL